MHIKSLLFWLGLLSAATCKAQDFGQHFGNDMRFLGHLFQEGLYQDAITATERIWLAWPEEPKRDSLNYLKARAYYQKGQFFPAYSSLSSLKEAGHPLFGESKLRMEQMVFAHPELSDYAQDNLAAYSLADKSLDSLRKLFLLWEMVQTGNADPSTAAIFGIDEPAYQEAMRAPQLNQCLEDNPVPDWKAWQPALLSSVVPGSGMFLMKRPLTGIGLFLSQGVFMVQAYESARKTGMEDARFIAFSSVGGVFYLANIFGTYWYANAQRKKALRYRRACLGRLMESALPAWK